MNDDRTPQTSDQALEAVLAAAAAAAGPLAALRPAERAGMLRAAADALDAAAGDLVPLAMRESSLPEGRLTGEVARSSGQLRLFADALEEGSHLEAIIDTADPDASPAPRPDLRRMLVPLGPVLVFAASNFPFAFSVPGGDTASALAAGAPVVLKAHPGHPELSRRTGEVLADALRAAGAPEGTFAVVHGMAAGTSALTDPRIKAAAFTGSVRGGRALLDIATTAKELLADPDALLQECFGPTSIVVEYSGADELHAAAEAFGGNLTATVHAEKSDDVAPLLERLRERTGRIVFNGWPTGVAVAAAMHHGGPWPATTASVHTSVGTTAVRRFLRPICYQDTPQPLLPEALTDRNTLGLPRRVNGTVTSGDVT